MPKTRTVTDRTLGSKLIKDVIDEQVGNFTQSHTERVSSYRVIHDSLQQFVRQVCRVTLRNGGSRPNIGVCGWKESFTNGADLTLSGNVGERLVSTEIAHLKQAFPKALKAIHPYCLHKLAHYTAYVSRMILHGLDPNLLRDSPEEIRMALVKEAQMLRARGVPVTVVTPGDNLDEVAEVILDGIVAQTVKELKNPTQYD